jgi:hypothetical protein
MQFFSMQWFHTGTYLSNATTYCILKNCVLDQIVGFCIPTYFKNS